MAITIVTGAPAAGKSTWVDSQRQPGDVAVDFDRISRALGSLTAHDAPDSVKAVALVARNAVVARVRQGIPDDAWIIQGNLDEKRLQEWLDFGARVVVVDPGKEECLRHAAADNRPEWTADRIEKWYAKQPAWGDRVEFIGKEEAMNRSRTVPGGRSWYEVKAAAEPAGKSVTVVRIFDEIGGFGVSADEFTRDLAAVGTDIIELRLDSPGGNVFQGIAIMNALRDHKARVEVVVDGIAASIASVIAMGGDRVVMNRGAQMMIHDAWSWSEGNAEDLKRTAESLEKCSVSIADIYAARAGGSREHWRELMRAETWFTAEEAVKAGLADSWVDEPAPRAHFNLSRFAYAGRENAPAPRIERKEGAAVTVDEFVAAVKEKLGVAADAEYDAVLAALTAALADDPADKVEEPAASLPDGVVAVDAKLLEQLRAMAGEAEQARLEKAQARREELVQAAVASGRIAPAARAVWLRQLEADEVKGAELLNTLAVGTVPVSELGHQAEPEKGEVSEVERVAAAAWGSKTVKEER